MHAFALDAAHSYKQTATRVGIFLQMLSKARHLTSCSPNELSPRSERPPQRPSREAETIPWRPRDGSDDRVVRSVDDERKARDAHELLERERRNSAALRTANESMKRLLVMLAHDLRGPLNSVLGWAELLRREALERGARNQALDVILRNVRLQRTLVDELLDIARMSEGKLQVELCVCDAARIARHAIESVAPSAEAASLTLEYDGPLEGALVIADRRRLAQVLANLLSNAIKYTSSGGHVRVVVGRERQWRRIEVVDTGRGIAPAHLPHLFEWFRQHVQHPEDARSGLGLGLYIVRQLIELQGGSVRADSAGEGRGSTFTVLLRHANEAALAPSDADPPTVPGRRALDGRRVLVVADEDSKVELLARLLRVRGAQVMEARTTREAAALALHEPPDAVVFDNARPRARGCSSWPIRSALCHIPKASDA
jgi:signal transduction histidine kinase